MMESDAKVGVFVSPTHRQDLVGMVIGHHTDYLGNKLVRVEFPDRDPATYHSSGLVKRATVPAAIVRQANRNGLALDVEDITKESDGTYAIDGMPWMEWLSAMTD